MNNKVLIISLSAIILSIAIFIKLNINSKIILSDKYYDSGKYIEVNDSYLNNLIKDKESFLLFVYNNYCNLPIPCENIFQEAIKDYKIDMLKIKFEDFKKTGIYQNIKYAPTVIIFSNGKVIAYLKADSDADLSKYQDENKFVSWLNDYVILQKWKDS